MSKQLKPQTNPETQTNNVKYTTVKIPKYLHEKIKEISESNGMKQWVLVEQAINLWLSIRKLKNKGKARSRVDRASWYAFKLAQSIGQLKANPTVENLQQTLRTIEQIEKRLNVDCKYLKEAIKWFMEKKDTESIITLNDETKLVIADIIHKLLIEELEQPRNNSSSK